MQNPPFKSLLDGIGNGVGYSIVLLVVGFFRELLGSGKLFGKVVHTPRHRGRLVHAERPNAALTRERSS